MKKLISFFCLIFSLNIIFAEDSFFEGKGGKNHTIMFANSVLENGIFDNSDEWICAKVKTNLISALNRFGGFSCVDMASTKNIIKVQKELESGLYDEKQSIEIGKLVRAKEIVNITSTRLASGAYSINVSLLNVESGVILGMYTSPKTFDSTESFAILAHYDCIPFLLNQLGVKQTSEGKRALQEEIQIAKNQVVENKTVAEANAKLEAERTELAEKQAKIAAEEKARKLAAEKAEYEANQKAIAEKKAREAAAAAKAKQQNPFFKETYVTEFENGSRYDKYIVKFVSQNECSITVISENSQGVKAEFTATGSYVYQNQILSVSARMKNDKVKHVQKIDWKGMVTFKNGYNTFYLMIPVNSNDNAKKIKAEFQRR